MTKKEYILAVIDALPEWEMGWGIKAMIQNNQLEEHTINMLVIIFKKAMDKITTTIKENKMIESIQTTDDQKHTNSLDKSNSKLGNF